MFTPEQRVFLVLLVTQAIRGIAVQFGREIGGKAAIVAAVIVGLAIGGIEAFANTLDPAAQVQTKAMITAVFGLLAAMGLYDTVRMVAPKPTLIQWTDTGPVGTIKVGPEFPGPKPTTMKWVPIAHKDKTP